MDFKEYKTLLSAAIGATRPLSEHLGINHSLTMPLSSDFIKARLGLVAAINSPISANETLKAFADVQMSVSSLVKAAAALNPTPNLTALCIAQELSAWKSAGELGKHLGLRISEHGYHLNISSDLAAQMNRKPRINKRLQNIIEEGFSK